MYRWENSTNLAANDFRLSGNTDVTFETRNEKYSIRNQLRSHRSNGDPSFNSLREIESRQKSANSTGSFGMTRSVGGVVKRRKHIVILGLDGSGKTTILMRLKFGCTVTTAPTIGFNHEKLWSGGYRWSAWDVGGGEKARPLWATYTRATDGIVFVIDASAPRDTLEEARVELSRVVKISSHTSNQLNILPPPILVLANFQDCINARGPEDIAFLMGLGETWASNIRWAVAPVCGLTGEGLDGAFMSLRALIDTKRKENRKKEKSVSAPPRWRW